ncbi:hypothetical protein D9M69_630860 [compost metagenome]
MLAGAAIAVAVASASASAAPSAGLNSLPSTEEDVVEPAGEEKRPASFMMKLRLMRDGRRRTDLTSFSRAFIPPWSLR